MRNFKKLTAISTILAILLTNSISFAANSAINNSTASAGAAWAIGDTITITSATNFPDWEEIASATITNLDWSAAWATTLTPDWDNTNDDTSTLTVAVANLTNNTSYIITFTTVDGDFWTTTLRLGTPTNDTIAVTANVQPVLKFALQSNSANLWTLTTAFWAWITTWVEIGTNAVNWVTVTATSSNWGLESVTAGHTINDSTNENIYSNEGYQFTSTLGVSDSTNAAVIAGMVATNVDDLNLTHTIYTSNDPQNYDIGWDYDTDFTVQARIAEVTPTASDYTDVIMFTATANF